MFSAKEITLLSRHDQSEADRATAMARAQEQRQQQLLELGSLYDTAKGQTKGVLASLIRELTGEDHELTDLESKGLNASIDPIIDNLANEAERRVVEPLTEHYRQIFELTRLDEAIGIYETEAEAVAAA